MAISEIYTVDSGVTSLSTTSQTPILELRSSGTVSKRAWIVGITFNVANSAATSGENVLFTLARVANTPATGTAVTPRPNDTASPAAITGAFAGSWGTAPTVGNLLWEKELPQSSGASWDFFPPLGYEFVLPVATASIAVFVTCASASTTGVQAILTISE